MRNALTTPITLLILVACGGAEQTGPQGAAGGGTGGAGAGLGGVGVAGGGVAGGGMGGAGGASAGTSGSTGDAGDGGAAGAIGVGGAAMGGAGGVSAGAGGAAGAANGGGAGTGAEEDCRNEPCRSGWQCLPSPGACFGTPSCLDRSAITCVERPVCGCDGTVYPSNCAAHEAGVGIGSASQCTTPDGFFECLDSYCDRAAEYCDSHRHYGSSQFPVPCEAGASWAASTCHPLPGACGSNPSCDCVSAEPFESGGPSSCNPNCIVVDGAVHRSCISGCGG